MGQRLAKARAAAGFRSARSAATKFERTASTYGAHENGQNNFDMDVARKYGRAFKVNPLYLLHGIGTLEEQRGWTEALESRRLVPVVGYVGAGAATHRFADSQGELEWIDAPPNSSGSTVAVKIRGESLGSFFDQWMVFYDDKRDPPDSSLIGRLCVCGVTDGRVLIKKLKRGGEPGSWTLLSQFEEPIYDVFLDWAARVKTMEAR